MYYKDVLNYSESFWKSIKERLDFLESELTLVSDRLLIIEYQKEYAFIHEVYKAYALYIDFLDNIESIEKEIKETSEKDLIILFESERENLFTKKEEILLQLEESLFLSSNEVERKSLFLEIRAGTGGLEASLFAANLTRMYQMYAIKMGWKFAIVHTAETEIGGIREIVLHIEGKKAFDHLQNESGVHRVQRVPDTETSGRIHTSTATVAVLPEVEEVEININPQDLRIDTYRASGAGGQHVNKTDSAIRITHIPSGVVVACQEERSQHKNRARAMKMLQSRLFAAEKEKQDSKMSQMRKEMVASAERSDKVRTYNYPQNRVTDHQINVTINRLEYIMQGDLNDIIEHFLKKQKLEKNLNPLLNKFL